MHAASAFYPQLATGQTTAQAEANQQPWQSIREMHADRSATEASSSSTLTKKASGLLFTTNYCHVYTEYLFLL